MSLIRIDLSPREYVHIPQAPVIERRPLLERGPGNEWHLWGVSGRQHGELVGISNHTWSHIDAPFHLLPDGASLEQIPPAHYLALHTRLVDLSGAEAPDRRETIGGIDYHSVIDEADLPASLDPVEAVLFVTGFGRLIDAGYATKEGADAHYPHVTAAAARRLASLPSLRVLAIDSPSFDKPHTDAAAHRALLGRKPHPVMLCESLTCERLRQYVSPVPPDGLLTIEPLRAFGTQADGALASVYVYVAEPGSEGELHRFSAALRGARLVV